MEILQELCTDAIIQTCEASSEWIQWTQRFKFVSNRWCDNESSRILREMSIPEVRILFINMVYLRARSAITIFRKKPAAISLSMLWRSLRPIWESKDYAYLQHFQLWANRIWHRLMPYTEMTYDQTRAMVRAEYKEMYIQAWNYVFSLWATGYTELVKGSSIPPIQSRMNTIQILDCDMYEIQDRIIILIRLLMRTNPPSTFFDILVATGNYDFIKSVYILPNFIGAMDWAGLCVSLMKRSAYIDMSIYIQIGNRFLKDAIHTKREVDNIIERWWILNKISYPTRQSIEWYHMIGYFREKQEDQYADFLESGFNKIRDDAIALEECEIDDAIALEGYEIETMEWWFQAVEGFIKMNPIIYSAMNKGDIDGLIVYMTELPLERRISCVYNLIPLK